MRILFMGSPDFAVKTLESLVLSGFSVVAAVTVPDKPKGRGYEIVPTAVSKFCEQNGIEIYKPQTLKNGELLPILEKYTPDCIVVSAYGKILPEYVLSYPRFGCVNVHASILPKYRGASPINFAIINGETETGITTMLMDKGIDTGDILKIQKTPISPEDNAETLHDRLAEIGGKLIVETLNELFVGKITPQKQPDEFSSAPLITNEIRKIDFSLTKREIINKVRGLSPVPTAFTVLDGKIVKIFSAEEIEVPTTNFMCVKAADGYIRLKDIAVEGKRRMSDEEFLRGIKNEKKNKPTE